jgi:ribosomal protein S18 acetylase RimI-like enzyme
MQYFKEYINKLRNITGGENEDIKIIIGNYKDYNPSKIVSEKEKKDYIGKKDVFASAYINDNLTGSLRAKFIDDSYVIRDVYVLPKYRGLGIGKKLMIKIMDHLKNKKIILYVDPKNEVAINLYKKLGFILIKEKDEYGDKYEYI